MSTAVRALVLGFALFCVSCQAYDRATYQRLIDAHDATLDAVIDAPLDARRDVAVDVAVDARDSDVGTCSSCPSGQSCCGPSCADLQFDPMHCGSCTNACFGTTCSAGTCTSVCRLGFLDCDGNVVNGCEVDAATDTNNCGSCGRACPAGRTCITGTCACAAGSADCDGNTGNGCEVNTATDAANCGACSHACGSGQTCTAGACICDSTHADCDGVASNGCETDLQGDSAHCGACATSCGTGSMCTAGVCQCNAGFLRCPAGAPNCAVSVTDPNNCGACGVTCTGATPFCASTGCIPACTGTQRACGTSCADLDTDPSNCGTCGHACPVGANAVARCTLGVCGQGCVAGFGDCNGNATDGCEVDLRTTSSNCGVCGTSCSTTQICSSGACTCPTGQRDCGGGLCAACCADADCSDGSACTADSCVSGTCQHVGCAAGNVCCGGLSCNACCSNADCATIAGNYGCAGNGTCTVCLPGYANCDGNSANGCETAIATSVSNCGACGQTCSFPNAVPACAGGACAIGACTPGFANCDGIAANGCEVNLNSDASNCGRCGMTCTAPANTCSGGACAVPLCPAGRGDCDGNASNGCETDLTSSLANCGACGTACTFAGGTASCTASVCTLTSCNTGFGNCDGVTSNGCETNLNTTVSHCGSCSNACSYANASATCSVGSCALGTCSAGFADCDGSAANGCELATSADVTHCGSCTTVCATGPNATATCSGGLCGISCAAGFSDCDRVASTGCETSTQSSTTNCGICGHACAAGELCAAGTCFLPASSFRIDALGVTGCSTQEHSALTGFDRAGLVASTSRVFYDGTYGTGIWDLPNFANATVGAQYDALVSDLHTGRVFALGTRMAGPMTTAGGRVNALLEIDPSTGALNGTQITLSTQINLANNTGFFSGWDRVVVHNGARAYSISLAGTVTDLGAMPVPTHQACAGWGYWGVAEYYSGSLYLTFVQDSTTIVRAHVPDGAVTTVATFTSLATTCAITLSPTRSRWYFHYSGAGQFASGSEIIGYCSATWSAPDTGCPAGSAMCATGCHYLATDDANCATCGTACSSGNVCIASACGVACPAGQSICSGVCRSLSSDVNNCGTCGNVCATVPNAVSICSAGGCSFACNYGYANCNGLASDGCEANTLSSTSNCGFCGNTCGAGTGCCSGACRDITSDPANCGACFTTCAAPQTCTSSACLCPLMCGTTCVDPLIDSANCGGCGVACAAGSVCSNGTCRSPFVSYTSGTSPLAFVNACAQAVHSEYLPNADDQTATTAMPFGFLFYGAAYRSVWFSSNGLVGFGTSSTAYLNACLPTTSPANAIFAYWDDLYTRTRVCTATLGAAPNRQFVITWDDARLFGDSTAHLTFSTLLSEGANTVDVLYQTLTAATAPGSSATLGVENAAGTVATQFSCNTASVSSGSTIRYTGM